MDDRTRQVREQFGLSIWEAQRAVKAADERFDGDLTLGHWFVHAGQFAIFVKGDRDAWNEAYARRRVNG